MYFVVKDGLNYSNPVMQNLVCGGENCNNDSVSTQIFVASKQSNRCQKYYKYIDNYIILKKKYLK